MIFLTDMRILLKLIPLLFLFNCAVNHKYHPTGYIDLNKNVLEKKDGKNRVYIMEEPATWTNNWHFSGNNYYADNEYITKLTYGMSYVYATLKKKVKISLASTYGGGNDKGNIMETNKLEHNRYGSRSYDVNFAENNNVYLITYSNYNNFQTGGTMLGAFVFDATLKKNGEPFLFRKVSKDVWWKMHEDPNKKDFYAKKMKENDLIKARELQGLK